MDGLYIADRADIGLIMQPYAEYRGKYGCT